MGTEREDFIEDVKITISDKIGCRSCGFYYDKENIESNDKCCVCNGSRDYFKSDGYRELLRSLGIGENGNA